MQKYVLYEEILANFENIINSFKIECEKTLFNLQTLWLFKPIH